MINKKNKKNNFKKKNDDFDSRVISMRRVTKVRAGGKRFRMSVMVCVGDYKGKIGIGLGKGVDTKSAINKAIRNAKRNIILVDLKDTTIAHDIFHKNGAAKVFLKPARKGVGVIAGGAVRTVLELAGIKDILAKRYGTTDQNSNVICTVEALKRIKSFK